jgi:hypothetical protein
MVFVRRNLDGTFRKKSFNRGEYMYNKYRTGEKGLWILIQRYPDRFFICPSCGDISYNRLDNKSINACVHNEKFNSFEFNLKYEFIFQCKICGFISTGHKLCHLWELSEEFIKDFFTDECTTIEERTFENFKILIKDYVEQMSKELNLEEMTLEECEKWKNREGKYSRDFYG